MTIHMWSRCCKAGCRQIVGSPVLQKSYIIFMSLVLVTLLLLPVALYHYNKITIGFVIHKNNKKDIWYFKPNGCQMRQVQSANVKLQDGCQNWRWRPQNWSLSTKTVSLANIYHHAKQLNCCPNVYLIGLFQDLAARLVSIVHGCKQCRLYVYSLLCQSKLSEID